MRQGNRLTGQNSNPRRPEHELGKETAPRRHRESPEMKPCQDTPGLSVANLTRSLETEPILYDNGSEGLPLRNQTRSRTTTAH